MYLFFPLLTVNITENKKTANHLCKSDKKELANFQEKYLNKIISVVAQLDKHFTTTPDRDKSPIAWLNTTKGKYFWDEESGEIYAWVILRIQTLSCRYKGEAPLINYLFASLSKEWTKIDFIRHETKITGYVPPYVLDYGEDHEKVYLMLVRYKPEPSEDQLMCSKLGMDITQYAQIKNEIESLLKEKGKVYRIQKEDSPLSLDQIIDKEDDNNSHREPASPEPSPDIVDEYRGYIRYMKKSYDVLDVPEQWFVKSLLVKNRKAKEVFNILQNDKVMKKYKSFLNIKSEKSVYNALERILYKVEKQIVQTVDKKEFPGTINPVLIKQWLQNTLLYGEKL